MKKKKNNSLAPLIVTLVTLSFVVACSKPTESKPPERSTQITAATAKTMNLSVVETASGAETALGVASDYDPTRLAGGAFNVRLTFPEHVAAQLKVGQSVRISSFGDESKSAPGTIREIRPSLSATTLSREVIVAVRTAGGWRPSGSVRGEVTLGVHPNAVVVPEQAVVLRPAGTVVYVVDNGVAREQPVKTGIARAGVTEITEGLKAGATVAVDGAALLADGTKVTLREPAQAPPRQAKDGG
jgi:membrane fusion protein (multidrug efflux system)